MFLFDFVNDFFTEDEPSCTLLGFEMHDDLVCEEIGNVVDVLISVTIGAVIFVVLYRSSIFILLMTSVIKYYLIMKLQKRNTNPVNLHKFKELLKTLEEQQHQIINILRCWTIKLLKRTRKWSSTYDSKAGSIPSRIKSSFTKFLKQSNKIQPQMKTVHNENRIKDVCEDKKNNDVQFLFVNNKYLNANDVNINDLQIREIGSDNMLIEIKQNIKTDNIDIINNSASTTSYKDEFQTEDYNDKNIIQDNILSSNNKSDSNASFVDELKMKKSCIRRIYLHLVMLIPLSIECRPQIYQNRLKYVKKLAISNKKSNTCKQHKLTKNNNVSTSCDNLNLSSNSMFNSNDSSFHSDVKIKRFKSTDTYKIDKSESDKNLSKNKVNEYRKSNVTIRLEGNKRRNLLRYLESINEERKKKMQNEQLHTYNCAILRKDKLEQFQKFSYPMLSKKKTRKVNFRSTNMNQNRTSSNYTNKFVKLQSSIKNDNISTNLKEVNDKKIIVIKPNVTTNSCDIRAGDTTSVKDEIVNNIVNIPEDALDIARHRYILHKSNKGKKSPSNNSLDVIQEHYITDVSSD